MSGSLWETRRIAAETFDGVFLVATPLNFANAALIGRLSRQERLPTVSGFATGGFVEAGGLLSYSTNAA